MRRVSRPGAMRGARPAGNATGSLRVALTQRRRRGRGARRLHLRIFLRGGIKVHDPLDAFEPLGVGPAEVGDEEDDEGADAYEEESEESDLPAAEAHGPRRDDERRYVHQPQPEAFHRDTERPAPIMAPHVSLRCVWPCATARERMRLFAPTLMVA